MQGRGDDLFSCGMLMGFAPIIARIGERMESFRTVVDARAMGSLSRIGQWMSAVAHQVLGWLGMVREVSLLSGRSGSLR